jgi:SET domain-containing protein
LIRRRSRIAGDGVYTNNAITKNTRIAQYTGERISHQESDRRERAHLAAGRVWCFTLNRRVVIDASVGGGIARFINHACAPNCYSRVIGSAIWICAARNISKGEELTYRYHTDGAAGIACRCRPGCQTRL